MQEQIREEQGCLERVIVTVSADEDDLHLVLNEHHAGGVVDPRGQAEHGCGTD
jgi:hypothetical protein